MGSGINVFVLFPDFQDGFAYLDSTGFDDDLRFALIDGEKVTTGITHDLTIKRKSASWPDFLGTGSSEFLVSERFKSALERTCPRDALNFVPIQIDGHLYYLLNTLGLRDAMDLENSVYTAFDDGFPDTIERLVVLPEKGDKYDVFRLEAKSELVFVSEDMKALLEAENLTGFKFFEGRNLEVLQ